MQHSPKTPKKNLIWQDYVKEDIWCSYLYLLLETGQCLSAKQHIMMEVNKQQGEKNAALTQVIDDLMAKDFRETSEKAKSHMNRL